MKIGTISLNINTDDLNYGAILHSFAFQKVLDSLHVQNEIIDYVTPSLEKHNLKYPTLNYLKRRKYYLTLTSLLRIRSHAVRYEKFKRFQKENLRVSALAYSLASLSNANLEYDTVVCESDVIWAPSFFAGSFDPAFFLALPSMKSMYKASYAASMANADLSAQQIKELYNLIKGIDAISVRETYARDLIQKNYNLPVECVLDPTLLLSQEDYSKITAKKLVKEPYVLLYFPLGYSTKIIRIVREYAKNKNLKVVECSRYPWDKVFHETILDAGVEEWLSLIKHAETIFSNSFHAACFSMIFEKDFYAFSRKTGRKIGDLCCRVGHGIEERYITDDFKVASPINYKEVNQQLERLRTHSLNFIMKNILKTDN